MESLMAQGKENYKITKADKSICFFGAKKS